MTRPPQISPLFPSPPLSRSSLKPPDEPVREVGKPFEQPPLGRPKRGTRVQSDQKPPTLKAQRFEPFFRPLLLSVGNDQPDRKSTRLNSSHGYISYAVFCLKK